MDGKWVVKTIAELAFVREPIKFYGYGMDKGIILIADDDESALVIKSMLEAHLDAVGMKLRGRKESQPLNYQMGVHVYNRLDDERKLLDFLEEQEFLPVVITGGLISGGKRLCIQMCVGGSWIYDSRSAVQGICCFY